MSPRRTTSPGVFSLRRKIRSARLFKHPNIKEHNMDATQVDVAEIFHNYI